MEPTRYIHPRDKIWGFVIFAGLYNYHEKILYFGAYCQEREAKIPSLKEFCEMCSSIRPTKHLTKPAPSFRLAYRDFQRDWTDCFFSGRMDVLEINKTTMRSSQQAMESILICWSNSNKPVEVRYHIEYCQKVQEITFVSHNRSWSLMFS